MPGTTSLNRRKIVILGSRSVGKSSLVKQFIDGTFSGSYYPNTDSTTTKTIMYNGTEYPCEIIDTAGQDEFSPLKSQHAIGVHGYIFVYSIASRASFNMVQVLYDKIVEYSGIEGIAAIIVGSKADLDIRRQVPPEDGQELALRNKAAWTEASALWNANIGNVFERCLAEIEKGNAPPQAPVQQRARGCCMM
ncbi:P-loop containing nucleoside triphosphate hydrolase protein [Mycena polygramma]|nr:P-loop containing nucleoside triphosphate hydrolase protein [Mycena polygramma]